MSPKYRAEGFIDRFQVLNGNGKSAVAVARELFDAYGKSKQTQRRMARVLIGLLEDSGSFAEAKAHKGYLEGWRFGSGPFQPEFARPSRRT